MLHFKDDFKRDSQTSNYTSGFRQNTREDQS